MRILNGALLAAMTGGLLAASTPAAAQTLQTNVYGNLDYHVAGASHAGTTSSFAVPTLDLFFRGQAGKLSLLTEVIFDIPEGNSFEADIDRLVLSYEFSEALKLSAGRFHLALGYVNTAYPHGAAIYLLSVARPVTVSQFDEKALLPALGVGINISGRFHVGPSIFSYDLEVLNGRGESAAEIVNANDHNNEKAVNVRLRYEPGFLSGLVLGINGYLDNIPAALADPTTMISPRPFKLREQVFGAHAAYVEYPYHLITEVYLVQHIGNGQTSTSKAWFAEAGYSFGPFTPYLREELVAFPSHPDPFYALTAQQQRGNFQGTSAGIKWSPFDYLAFKLELEWNHAQVDSEYSAIWQAAFGF
jgi:hypothetical protein